MFVKAVLIIDKRKEQSVKYKKILEHSGITVFLAADFPRALEIISRFEPDLILISDSFGLDMKKIIEHIRILTCNTRPDITALSKSSHIQDKIDILDAGADDFLSEPMSSEEFKARITALIRRNFENSLSEKTMLFNSKITYKILKRTINSAAPAAVMLIDIDRFEDYKEIYGELAADKLLLTCSAVIKPALQPDDYSGHISDSRFIVITGIERAESIAEYIINTFDSAVLKFYSRIDRERGYMFMHGDDAPEDKSALVSLSIGIITNKYTKYTDIKQVLNSLEAVHKLAKHKKGSSFVIERLKIASKEAVQQENRNILIAEPDEALSILLEASARLSGFNVKAVNEFDEIFEAAEAFNPAVIILDAGSAETLKGLDICRRLKSELKNSKINIILTAAVHDKELVLSAGADLYLPKPYELSQISSWIKKFVSDFNS